MFLIYCYVILIGRAVADGLCLPRDIRIRSRDNLCWSARRRRGRHWPACDCWERPVRPPAPDAQQWRSRSWNNAPVWIHVLTYGSYRRIRTWFRTSVADLGLNRSTEWWGVTIKWCALLHQTKCCVFMNANRNASLTPLLMPWRLRLYPVNVAYLWCTLRCIFSSVDVALIL